LSRLLSIMANRGKRPWRAAPRAALFIGLLPLSLVCLSACSPPHRFAPASGNHDPIAALLAASLPEQTDASALKSMEFSIQVGAFSSLDNAVGQQRALEGKGVDAYHFRHESGLYKVRFGDYATYAAARRDGETLQSEGVIGNFFIIVPQEYAAARIRKSGQGDIREELVRTARQFLDVPYRWGGTTENGFDCSGLTMVSYRLNGLNLPRVSHQQFKKGRAVAKTGLRKGDLVFFATRGGKQVNHVGLYIGDGNFIHAPRTGKTVRIASLSNSFFMRTYAGARTYL
jgi:hypothetical protein